MVWKPAWPRTGTSSLRLCLSYALLPGVLLGGPAQAQSVGAAPAPMAANPAAPHAGENGAAMQQSASAHFTLTYASDLLGDVSGGAKRGATYQGRLGLIVDFDLERLLGWRGATAHLSIHEIHGEGLSGHDVQNLLTVSGLEARPALRLFNLWVQQALGSRTSIRVGQFTAAQELTISETANLFVNSSFGWPASFATDLPSGGPAYPLAAPGVRLSYQPDNRIAFLAAVFAGDPAGPGTGDPQKRDRFGLNGFRFAGKPFVIAEAQRAAGGNDPARTLKLGGWVHFGDFDDLRFDSAGKPLADPSSSKVPRRRHRDAAAYAIADARFWRSGRIPARVLYGFVRGTISPSDRNPIDRYFDLGLSLTALLAARPDDTLGIGFAFARVSPRASALVADTNVITSSSLPLPDHEAAVELTYQTKVRPNISLQPDLQYILHPNGHAAPAPSASPARPIGNALVIGVRSSLRF